MGITQKSPFPPLLVLLFGIVTVSMASILTRFAQEDAPSLVIAASRMTIAALLLSPVALRRGRILPFNLGWKRAGGLILSGIFLAIHFATWITSLEFTSVTSSVVLVSTTPLWVALLSPMVLGERPTKLVWLGLFVTLTGAVLVGVGNVILFDGWTGLPTLLLTGDILYGNILALFGAWTVAGYVLIGRRIRVSIPLIPYIFIVYSIAAIVLLMLVGINGLSFTGYSPKTYIMIILLAVGPQLLGHTSYNWALAYLPAAYVSVAMLAEPVGATILAAVILAEPPKMFEIIGSAIVLAGIYITTKPR